MVFVYLYAFIVGLIFGSFFNVVGLRVPKKQSIVHPRSYCPKCGHSLTWYELIPVVSFLIQKGKCRNCHFPISFIYPSIEFVTGLLFMFALYKIGIHKELFLALTLISLLVIITVSDLCYQLIPNRILLVFFVLFIFLRIWIPLSPWYDSILGMVTGFILLYFIAVLSKGGMGGGDIKLFAVLGTVLGLKGILLTFFLSSLIGAIFGVFGIITKRLTRKSAIPFGPFISLGALLAYFYETDIFNWYIHLLL
jgi:leader peptidase (prepilin peptidase)/N-methyltransferase